MWLFLMSMQLDGLYVQVKVLANDRSFLFNHGGGFRLIGRFGIKKIGDRKMDRMSTGNLCVLSHNLINSFPVNIEAQDM